jgi:TM2 domain-containing membrane protein YozV
MGDPIKYYVMLEEEKRGPYTLAQLQTMWRSGSLTVDTQYWFDGQGEWMPLSTILELLEPQERPRAAYTYFAAPAQRVWSPGAALVLSFFIPGLGQMYRGRIGRGILWFIGVVIGYSLLVIPGIIAHLICLVDAYSGDPTKEKG